MSSSSSPCPASLVILQQTVALVIKRSSGLRECIHWGRKSHVWSLVGRWLGLWVCITFTIAIKMVTPRKGAPTAAITRQPASERPSTSEGRSKKQRRRYKTANQRYLAVRSPRTRAILTGRRRKGRGYQSRMPKMLKRRWHRAIYVQREDKIDMRPDLAYSERGIAQMSAAVFIDIRRLLNAVKCAAAKQIISSLTCKLMLAACFSPRNVCLVKS